MIPYVPSGTEYDDAFKLGRLMGCWLECPNASILCFNIYGWTGADKCEEALQRTDDLLCIIDEEIGYHPGAHAMIVGEYNASSRRIPKMVQ